MRELKQIFISVAAFSGCINLLVLISPLYMLQVYDRVLTSRSGSTLFFLTLYVILALATMAGLEFIRSRILVRAGIQFDRHLSGRLFSHVLNTGSSGQPLRDLEALRSFLTGNSILAILDSPWMPLFLVAIYMLHPALGHLALGGAVVLFVTGACNEYVSRKPLMEAGKASTLGTQFAETSARNAEVIRAMGMLGNLQRVWLQKHAAGIRLQAVASDVAGIFAAAAKFLRFGLQSAVLGLGAWLVLNEEITAGAMVAASILMGRAIAPVEMAISSWRNFLHARTAYAGLSKMFEAIAADEDKTRLPAPNGSLSLEHVYWSAPNRWDSVVSDVSMRLEAGSSLGIIGPSAAGKSTLARLVVGVRTPTSGIVRLDNADLSHWPREHLGPHIGYLPQDIELFSGTVAQNICRFGEPDSEQIVAAARLCGAHELILELPKGYDTPIGHGGAELSGGQRQRIGLARALYGLPALIVLDEPTSHLDAEGEAVVRQTLDRLKQLKRTVIVIAHRPTLIGGADYLLVLQCGVVSKFGRTAEVLPQITRRVVASAPQRADQIVAGVS